MPELMSLPRPAPELPVTRMESSDEIQAALHAARAAPADGEPGLERPLQRPPVALLCVIDDGKADGEWLRLRADRHVLGRVDGDVRVPHDALMSAAHAELVREKAKRGYQWALNDLGSTNGTWV